MVRTLPRCREHTPLNASGKVTYYTVVHNLYGVLAGGFEVALVLRLTGSFERIVWFQLLVFVLLYVGFAAGTALLRTGRASLGFRLDLAVQALGCAYVMANFASLSNPVVLGGFFVLKGTWEGIFWSTRHTAMIYGVPDHERDHWMLVLQAFAIVSGAVLPVLTGLVISQWPWPVSAASVLPSGYFPVYGLCGVLALVGLAASPRLTLERQTVRLAPLLRLTRARGSGLWWVFTLGATVCAVTVNVAVGVLNFSVLKTEFHMGLFASWIAVASAGFFLGLRALSRRSPMPRTSLVMAGSVGELLSRLIYAVFQNVPGLVAKSLADSFLVPLRTWMGENIIRRRIELIVKPAGASVAEGMLFQESGVLVGRITACLLLALVAHLFPGDPVALARGLLIAFIGYSAVDFLLLRALDRGNRRSISP